MLKRLTTLTKIFFFVERKIKAKNIEKKFKIEPKLSDLNKIDKRRMISFPKL